MGKKKSPPGFGKSGTNPILAIGKERKATISNSMTTRLTPSKKRFPRPASAAPPPRVLAGQTPPAGFANSSTTAQQQKPHSTSSASTQKAAPNSSTDMFA